MSSILAIVKLLAALAEMLAPLFPNKDEKTGELKNEQKHTEAALDAVARAKGVSDRIDDLSDADAARELQRDWTAGFNGS